MLKLILAGLVISVGAWLGLQADPSKAYEPGAYGKVKDAPMFVCWREWDGEVRIGGVAKMFSQPRYLTNDFVIEIQGGSCANREQLMFGDATTNIIIVTNYTGTIQVGTNFVKLSDLQKR